MYSNKVNEEVIEKVKAAATKKLKDSYAISFKDGLLVKCTRQNIHIDNIIFMTVIDTLNKEVSKLLLQGQRVTYNGEVGSIVIVKYKHKFSNILLLPVDWVATNAKKKEILDRGGLLYEVLERDEEGNVSKTNGGEEYLVRKYFSNYVIKWTYYRNRNKTINTELLEATKIYKFKPTDKRVRMTLKKETTVEILADEYRIRLDNCKFRSETNSVMSEIYDLNICNMQKNKLLILLNPYHVDNFITHNN